MAKKKRLCNICGANEATVPDRNEANIGCRINKVCGECHAARLCGDVAFIIQKHKERKLAADKIGRN